MYYYDEYGSKFAVYFYCQATKKAKLESTQETREAAAAWTSYLNGGTRPDLVLGLIELNRDIMNTYKEITLKRHAGK